MYVHETMQGMSKVRGELVTERMLDVIRTMIVHVRVRVIEIDRVSSCPRIDP